MRAALTASTALGRGLPMLALLLVRLSAFVARGLLEPPSQALLHYAAMEVGMGECAWRSEVLSALHPVYRAQLLSLP